MTVRLSILDGVPKTKSTRQLIPDHIPRQLVEPVGGDTDCAQHATALRGVGDDVTELLEYVASTRQRQRVNGSRVSLLQCKF